MKILQLSNKFVYPPKDGGAIGIFNFTKAFSTLGCDVTMLAMNTSKHPFNVNDLPDEIKKLAKWITADVDNRIKPMSALWNLLQNKSYHISRFISSEYNKALVELLMKNQFDIIQLEGLYLSHYVETIRKHSNAIIVLRSHNIEHEIWERISANEKSFFKKVYLKILARQLRNYEVSCLNKYDLVTTVTHRDADILKTLGCGLPVHVFPAPFDESVLKPDTSNLEYPSVFFIGALDWKPNIEGLIWFLKKVWPSVVKKLPDVKFYIAGRNASSANIPESQNVIMVGEVENAYSFMNSKGVMIVPLLSGSGIRVKIIEGMALSKTIVSTSVGIEGIDCTDEKNILIADTPEQFAQSILNCIFNKTFYEKIGMEAAVFARKNYGSIMITKNLLDLFKSKLPSYQS